VADSIGKSAVAIVNGTLAQDFGDVLQIMLSQANAGSFPIYKQKRGSSPTRKPPRSSD